MKKIKTLLVLSATVLGLGLTACGGKSGDKTTSNSNTPSVTTTEKVTTTATPTTDEPTPEKTPVEPFKDGKSIDTAIIVDIYRENTYTFDLKKDESLFLKFAGDGTMNDFFFEAPTGSGLSFTYAWYYENKTLNLKQAETTTSLYQDVSGTECVNYLEIIPDADGKYTYTVSYRGESIVGKSFETAILIDDKKSSGTSGTVVMENASAGIYYFKFVSGCEDTFTFDINEGTDTNKSVAFKEASVILWNSDNTAVYPNVDTDGTMTFDLQNATTYYFSVVIAKSMSFYVSLYL